MLGKEKDIRAMCLDCLLPNRPQAEGSLAQLQVFLIMEKCMNIIRHPTGRYEALHVRLCLDAENTTVHKHLHLELIPHGSIVGGFCLDHQPEGSKYPRSRIGSCTPSEDGGGVGKH